MIVSWTEIFVRITSGCPTWRQPHFIDIHKYLFILFFIDPIKDVHHLIPDYWRLCSGRRRTGWSCARRSGPGPPGTSSACSPSSCSSSSPPSSRVSLRSSCASIVPQFWHQHQNCDVKPEEELNSRGRCCGCLLWADNLKSRLMSELLSAGKIIWKKILN